MYLSWPVLDKEGNGTVEEEAPATPLLTTAGFLPMLGKDFSAMATFPRLGNGAIEVLGKDDSACDRPSSAG